MAATDVALAAIGEYVTKEGSMKQAILLMTNGNALEVKRPDNDWNGGSAYEQE